MDPIITPIILGGLILLGFIYLMTFSQAEEDAQEIKDEALETINDNRSMTASEKKRAQDVIKKYVFVEKKGEKYLTYSGVFNKNNGEILDGRRRESEKLDDDLSNLFKKKRVAVVG
jgi:hypothetical protein